MFFNFTVFFDSVYSKILLNLLSADKLNLQNYLFELNSLILIKKHFPGFLQAKWEFLNHSEYM